MLQSPAGLRVFPQTMCWPRSPSELCDVLPLASANSCPFTKPENGGACRWHRFNTNGILLATGANRRMPDRLTGDHAPMEQRAQRLPRRHPPL